MKIISTCHNLYAHVKYTAFSDLLYDWVYEASDVIVHLGIYSLSLLEQKYPCVKHVIIPHHVYDTIYTRLVDKSDALAYLGLSSKYKYILCLGAFRTTEEKKLFKDDNYVRIEGKPFFLVYKPQNFPDIENL